jgi:hypothetical protein
MKPFRLAAALAAVGLVAGGAGLVTTASTAATASAGGKMLGPNQVTLADQVPWDRVGHGWYLTLIDQGDRGDFGVVADHQLLDLVDPLGGRYQLAKTTVAKDGSGYRRLVDWSTDGRTAVEVVSGKGVRQRAVVHDLRAGTHRVVRLDRRAADVRLGPHGSLYEIRYGGRHGQPVLRRDSDGTTDLLLGRTDGHPLATRSGRRLVVGLQSRHDHRLLVLGSHGRLLRTLTTPQKCEASRWWRRGVVMARCDNGGRPRLYAAPLDGSPGHWLTADHGAGSADLGDMDARRLEGTTYLQADGPCGVVFLARQHRDGTATEVHVPKATANVLLLGTRGTRLVLQVTHTCDGGTSRDAITHFDPRTRDDRVVAELPADEEYARILGFAEHAVAIG